MKFLLPLTAGVLFVISGISGNIRLFTNDGSIWGAFAFITLGVCWILIGYNDYKETR